MVLAWGWRRAALAFGGGACGALALPGAEVMPALVLAASIGMLLLDGAEGGFWPSLRAASVIGWLWGFGYFLAGLWWLGAAFLVDAGRFAWALPLGVVALPAALALFPAFGFALARALWSSGPWRLFAFAAGLTAAEWLRAELFTGFPWNEIGMALGANLTTAQAASLVGLHGLTFFALLIAAAPATLWRPELRRIDAVPSALALLGMLGLAGFGAWRICAPAAPVEPNVRLRIVQPNIAQGSAFSADNADAILKTYFTLSDRATSPESSGIADVTHLIWPESAFPFLLARQAPVLRSLADFLKGGAVLITGAARAEATVIGAERPRIFNAIQIVDRSGLRPETYDKRRLVPFGEYLPFSGLLRRLGISQFVATPGGFSAGEGAQPLQPPGLPPALAMICYEAIFPLDFGVGQEPGLASARWILNVTDDAWFGLTPGPIQHFAQARLRAIELGLPMVRAANSGVSAITDGRGRALRMLMLGEVGLIDGPLPKPEAVTPQRRWGAVPGLILLAVGVMTAFRARRRDGAMLG